jgi:predicted O-methyltransferase YrrM
MDFTDVSNAYQAATPTIQQHVGVIEDIVKSSGAPLEGNSFYYHNSLTRFDQLLTKQINLFWAGSQVQKKILEIGFNAGHSAVLFLCAHGNEPIDFTIFDLGAHKYVKPCLEYVRSQWPSASIEYIEGDSTKTLPAFLAANQDKKGTYDVVHVDGGHDRDIVISDVDAAIDLVRVGGLMILDDTNIDYITQIADACVASGAFTEEKILDTVGYQHRILRRVQ